MTRQSVGMPGTSGEPRKSNDICYIPRPKSQGSHAGDEDANAAITSFEYPTSQYVSRINGSILVEAGSLRELTALKVVQHGSPRLSNKPSNRCQKTRHTRAGYSPI